MHLGKNSNGQLIDVASGDLVARDFYIYTAVFGTLAASATQQNNIKIEADSAFVVQKLTYFVTDSSETQQTFNTRILPNVTMAITDTGSGRNLQNSAVPISSLCGTGELPHILAQPKTFKANSIIETTIANLTATVLENVFINYIGYKIFRIRAG